MEIVVVHEHLLSHARRYRAHACTCLHTTQHARPFRTVSSLSKACKHADTHIHHRHHTHYSTTHTLFYNSHRASSLRNIHRPTTNMTYAYSYSEYTPAPGPFIPDTAIAPGGGIRYIAPPPLPPPPPPLPPCGTASAERCVECDWCAMRIRCICHMKHRMQSHWRFHVAQSRLVCAHAYADAIAACCSWVMTCPRALSIRPTASVVRNLNGVHGMHDRCWCT